MITVSIAEDEWYPVFSLDAEPKEYHKKIDIPEELFERYKLADNEFNAVQQKIIDILEKDKYFD